MKLNLKTICLVEEGNKSKLAVSQSADNEAALIFQKNSFTDKKDGTQH